MVMVRLEGPGGGGEKNWILIKKKKKKEKKKKKQKSLLVDNTGLRTTKKKESSGQSPSTPHRVKKAYPYRLLLYMYNKIPLPAGEGPV